MVVNKLLNNDTLVTCLSQAISRGESGLKNIPGLVKRVIEEEAWKERFIEITGETVKIDSFIDFVELQPLKGLGTTYEMLCRICADEPEVLDLLDYVVKRKAGNTTGNNQYTKNENIDIVNNSYTPNGNSKQYGLRKLRKSRPDLHKLVIDRKLTVNEAMIEAGLRKKQLVITAEIKPLVKAIKKYFSEEEILIIAEKLLFN